MRYRLCFFGSEAVILFGSSCLRFFFWGGCEVARGGGKVHCDQPEPESSERDLFARRWRANPPNNGTHFSSPLFTEAPSRTRTSTRPTRVPRFPDGHIEPGQPARFEGEGFSELVRIEGVQGRTGGGIGVRDEVQ